MEPNGVIFFNAGRGCLCRLAVAAMTLRRHYSGPAAIINDGKDPLTKQVAKEWGLDYLPDSFGMTTPGKHTTLLNKCLLHLKTPYEVSVYLDADTMTTAPFDELFTLAREKQFVATQFSDWRSDSKRIASRIMVWKKLYPNLIDKALAFGPALNTGVYAFHRDAEFYRVWWRDAMPGRNLIWIPDETYAQLALWKYPHAIVGPEYNRSCKHDDPRKPGTKIVHFHGRKHCRYVEDKHGCGWANNAQLWLTEYEQLPWWAQKLSEEDRQLRKYLPRWAQGMRASYVRR